MVYCCVPYCRSSSRNKEEEGVSLHQFPSNSDLLQKWLKVISRDNFVVNDKSPSSVVCSKHFRQEDFITGLKVKKLISNAVPSIFENYPTYKIPILKSNRRKLTRDDSKNNGCKRQNPGNSNSSNKRLKLEEGNVLAIATETHETSNSDLQHETSNSDPQHEISNSDPRHETEKSSEENSQKISSPIAVNKNYYGNILNQKRKDVRLLRSKLWKKENQVNKLKKELESVQQKLKYYESNNHHASLEKIMILQDTGDNKANFIVQQIENFSVKRPTWNEKIIRDSILLNSCSPIGYDFIRRKKLLTLPSVMTLKRYIGPFTGEYGVTSLIKDRLKEENF